MPEGGPLAALRAWQPAPRNPQRFRVTRQRCREFGNLPGKTANDSGSPANVAADLASVLGNPPTIPGRPPTSRSGKRPRRTRQQFRVTRQRCRGFGKLPGGPANDSGSPADICRGLGKPTPQTANGCRGRPESSPPLRRTPRAEKSTPGRDSKDLKRADGEAVARRALLFYSGSVKRQVMPSPTLLSAQIRPPWPCTMLLEM